MDRPAPPLRRPLRSPPARALLWPSQKAFTRTRGRALSHPSAEGSAALNESPLGRPPTREASRGWANAPDEAPCASRGPCPRRLHRGIPPSSGGPTRETGGATPRDPGSPRQAAEGVGDRHPVLREHAFQGVSLEGAREDRAPQARRELEPDGRSLPLHVLEDPLSKA